MSLTIGVPADLRIGGGVLESLPAVLQRLGVARPLIVTDGFLLSTGLEARVAALVDTAGGAAAVFADTVPDPTSDSLAAGLASIAGHRADAVIGLGGGSPIDTAKALAVLSVRGGGIDELKAPATYDGPALPVIAIPTTAGTGSEATRFTIITDSSTHEKMLCAGAAYLPAAALVDFRLTLSMPPRLTADTGIDALTHAVEAYVSRRRNDFSDALALSAIRTLGRFLERAYRDGDDEEARAAVMEAATFAGIAFSNSSVALVHGMSRPLGGHFGIAHGMANAMLFAAVTEFSVDAATVRYADCARALGVAGDGDDDRTAAAALVTRLVELRAVFDIPSPRTRGIDRAAWRAEIPEMAAQALASGSPANNPRVPSAAQIEELFERIYDPA